MKRVLPVVFFFACHWVYSQNEFFHEISVAKTLSETEKWDISAEANWKHIYDEVGWRRAGIDFEFERELQVLKFSTGASTYYTFNKKIQNFWEFRPWIALGLRTDLFRRISFLQRIRAEWRNFRGENVSDNYDRIRYRLILDYAARESTEKPLNLQVASEWYFFDKPTIVERFPRFRDFSIRVIKGFPNMHRLILGYKIEFFLDETDETVGAEGGNGHLVMIGYEF